MIDFEKQLNSEQLKVVQHGDGPCLVLAGAGSGKTRTITYRVAYLLEKGVEPKNILLVTFTNKAAQEMKNRVSMITHGNINLPWSGTYHHIAYRILRQYAKLLGYENNFTVLDSEDSLDLLKLCIKQEGIDRKQRRFPSPAVIHSVISFSRNAEMTIEDVLDRKHPHWLEWSETIIRIADAYQKRKVQANAMDFDDLLVNWYLLLLKFPQVKEKFARQFEYILVDEYQDTNRIQASIIKLLASQHQNILVVGDDAQSIYSFRAADIQHILDFSPKGGSASGGETGYPNAKVFKLETNYRSTPNILDVANNVISQNRSQYKKDLKSVVDPLINPEVYSFTNAQEEAEFITERIVELEGEGTSLNEIAVLFRAAFHSQALEMELVKRDIPYDYRGGVRFFERAHIKDVLAYLRIYANKNDAIAWSRVLNMQVGIGPVGAQTIHEFIVHSSEFTEETLQHAGSLLSARGQVGWNDFLQIWSVVAKAMVDENATPGHAIEALLNSKYVDYLESEYPDYRERIDDIKQLAAFAQRQKDLSQFLAESSMQESYSKKHVRDLDGDREERVVLSTIHQAKGLEWDAVFIINLSAGQFPNDRALREDGGIEEERRLFYVAITRARKLLCMSYPLLGWSASMLQGPSMFIEEIDRDLIDEHTHRSETVFDDLSDDVDDISYESFDDDKPVRNFLKDLDDL